MKDGQRHGHGVEYIPNGSISYCGNFVDNQYDSSLSSSYYCCINGKIIYVGGYQIGNKNGFGIAFHSNGQIRYIGMFMNNLPDTDFGRIFNRNGKQCYEGVIRKGRTIDHRPFYCFC